MEQLSFFFDQKLELPLELESRNNKIPILFRMKSDQKCQKKAKASKRKKEHLTKKSRQKRLN